MSMTIRPQEELDRLQDVVYQAAVEHLDNPNANQEIITVVVDLDAAQMKDAVKLDKELQLTGANRRYEKIHELICRMLTYTMRDEVKMNHRFLFKNGLQIMLNAEYAYNEHGNKKVCFIRAVTSAAGMGVGLFGISPLFTAAVSASTASLVAQSGQPITTALSTIGETYKEGGPDARKFYFTHIIDRFSHERNKDMERERASQQHQSSCSQALSTGIDKVSRQAEIILGH